MPVRTQGVAAGLLLLAVSPIIALVGSHRVVTAAGPGGEAVASAATAAIAAREVQPALHLLPPRDPSLRDPAPTPTPTPPPLPPTPAAVRAVAKTTAPPLPPAPPPAPGTIEAIIQAAATKWGVSYPWMLKIAHCESSLNPRAYNPAGPYIGLFQFLPSTFRAHGGTDIYDPVQQADITANMLAHGGARAWGCA